ncbi:fiber-1 [Pigeon adenovirus 2a]|nr:fiber-1 [Pigeon adenovirus 2a]
MDGRNDNNADEAENGTDETVDLVYPFTESGGSAPSITVDPDGPLNLEGNMLSLATTVPLSVVDQSLKLLLDSDSFALKQPDHSLTLKIIPPFYKTPSGLQIMLNNSLAIVNTQLQVKLDPDGGLTVTPNGLALQSSQPGNQT